MIEVSYDVLNEDMREGDIYEIQTEVSSRNRGTFIYGDKCIFLQRCGVQQKNNHIGQIQSIGW